MAQRMPSSLPCSLFENDPGSFSRPVLLLRYIVIHSEQPFIVILSKAKNLMLQILHSACGCVYGDKGTNDNGPRTSKICILLISNDL